MCDITGAMEKKLGKKDRESPEEMAEWKGGHFCFLYCDQARPLIKWYLSEKCTCTGEEHSDLEESSAARNSGTLFTLRISPGSSSCNQNQIQIPFCILQSPSFLISSSMPCFTCVTPLTLIILIKGHFGV